jgi:hypothetical protein
MIALESRSGNEALDIVSWCYRDTRTEAMSQTKAVSLLHEQGSGLAHVIKETLHAEV